MMGLFDRVLIGRLLQVPCLKGQGLVPLRDIVISVGKKDQEMDKYCAMVNVTLTSCHWKFSIVAEVGRCEVCISIVFIIRTNLDRRLLNVSACRWMSLAWYHPLSRQLPARSH